MELKILNYNQFLRKQGKQICMEPNLLKTLQTLTDLKDHQFQYTALVGLFLQDAYHNLVIKMDDDQIQERELEQMERIEECASLDDLLFEIEDVQSILLFLMHEANQYYQEEKTPFSILPLMDRYQKRSFLTRMCPSYTMELMQESYEKQNQYCFSNLVLQYQNYYTSLEEEDLNRMEKEEVYLKQVALLIRGLERTYPGAYEQLILEMVKVYYLQYRYNADLYSNPHLVTAMQRELLQKIETLSISELTLFLKSNESIFNELTSESFYLAGRVTEIGQDTMKEEVEIGNHKVLEKLWNPKKNA